MVRNSHITEKALFVTRNSSSTWSAQGTGRLLQKRVWKLGKQKYWGKGQASQKLRAVQSHDTETGNSFRTHGGLSKQTILPLLGTVLSY